MATQQDRTPLLPLTPPSAVHQTTVILCDYGSAMGLPRGVGTVLSQRSRTSGSGRTSVRMTLDIKATPLLANLNGMELGKGPSEAIRAILEEQSLNITATVTPATRLFRERMKRAYLGQTEPRKTRLSRGAQVPIKRNDADLARERYAAGRMMPRVPGGLAAARVGVDSGRLARGWFVRQNPKEGAWTINSPANRFSLDTWLGDAASLQAWIARFVSLVPALRDPRTILNDQRFRDAVAKSPPVVKITRTNLQALKDFIRAAGSSAQQADALLRNLGV